ncbi:hypothetical protein [Singulisphaera sp. PoT]|uniref:hypothetical protein n=1 Tax=Singulisphaera sp. PoT TaxID=3411797 RepID=UPI003BF524A7
MIIHAPQRPDPIRFRVPWGDRIRVIRDLAANPPEHPFVKGWFCSFAGLKRCPDHEHCAVIEVAYDSLSYVIERDERDEPEVVTPEIAARPTTLQRLRRLFHA